jgi:pantoate--beta-alanine ligase
METIKSPRIMNETSGRLSAQGRTIGLVPTMGALHDGHLSLVKQAVKDNDIVVVSVFVNPTQFGPNEDFGKYPRDLDGDMRKLADAGVTCLFAPDVESVYPEGFATSVEVGGITSRLCGRFRPGHFSGVATVVSKLFNMVMPARAYFGRKDYQQLRVIETFVSDLNMNVEVVGCPIIRESDGLAMSSRNRYLSPSERVAALTIYKTLRSAADMARAGAQPSDVNKHMNGALCAEPLVSEIQYAGAYDPLTLEDKKIAGGPSLLAVAVVIGNTRLIDNLLIEG